MPHTSFIRAIKKPHRFIAYQKTISGPAAIFSCIICRAEGTSGKLRFDPQQKSRNKLDPGLS